jgi:hypothetical protein
MKSWVSRLIPNLGQASSIPSANPTSRDLAPYDSIPDFELDSTPNPLRELGILDLTIDEPLLTKISRTWSIIIPFEDRYLNIAPNIEKVIKYDTMTLRQLIALAHKGNQGIELLVALHRQMAADVEQGRLNRLDCVPRDPVKQARRLELLHVYDRKFEIKREVDILAIERPRTPAGQYRGPV